MNPRPLMLVVAAIVGAGAVLAQSPHSHRLGDTAVLHDQLTSAPSQRSRAEVHAEAIAANKARAGASTYEDGARLDRMLSTPSSLSRVQVRAEAIEARRLGLMTYGESDQPRVPTPAELESIRQAGLRAIGMENVTARR